MLDLDLEDDATRMCTPDQAEMILVSAFATTGLDTPNDDVEIDWNDLEVLWEVNLDVEDAPPDTSPWGV